MGHNNNSTAGGGNRSPYDTSRTTIHGDGAPRSDPAPGFFVSQLEQDTDLPHDPYQGRTPEQWQRNEDMTVVVMGLGFGLVALTILIVTIRALLG